MFAKGAASHAGLHRACSDCERQVKLIEWLTLRKEAQMEFQANRTAGKERLVDISTNKLAPNADKRCFASIKTLLTGLDCR